MNLESKLVHKQIQILEQKPKASELVQDKREGQQTVMILSSLDIRAYISDACGGTERKEAVFTPQEDFHSDEVPSG